MTDDQTERVARAICKKQYEGVDYDVWAELGYLDREALRESACAAIAAMPGWRDIESAPRGDGTWVLVHSPKTGIEIRLADGDWWRKYGGPTKWTPLPPPPVE